MKNILEQLKRSEAKIEIQYFDYDLNTWTVPQLITDSIINSVCNDGSVRRIRITTEI